MLTIHYNGKDYPVRYIANGARISTESLCDAFERDLNGDATGIAEDIDNTICGYVPDEDINLPTYILEGKCRKYGIVD